MAQRVRTDTRSAATVAILGDNPVICYAIAQLIQAAGYATRVVDLALEQETPADVDVVLVTSCASPGRDLLQHPCGVPVLQLVDLTQDGSGEPATEGRVPWPCPAEELQKNIRLAVERRDSCSVSERATRTPPTSRPESAG